MRRTSVIWLFCALGCGGATATAKTETAATSGPTKAQSAAEPAKASDAAGQPPSAAASAAGDDAEKVSGASAGATATSPGLAGDEPSAGELGKLPVDPPLAPEVNAGVISRVRLKEVLSRGVARFLQDVRTEPQMVKGKFTGWRILSLFEHRPEVKVAVLRPGDTVRRANGQSIERPEAFKEIWDSLGTANEIVLDIERAGQPSKLRYTITD